MTKRQVLRVLGLVFRDQRGEVVPADLAAVVKEAIKGELKPLGERLDAIDKRFGDVDAKVGGIEKRVTDVDGKVGDMDKAVVRYDATGKVFKFGPGGEQKAPAHVRSAGNDSKPLSLLNIWRAVNLGKSNPGVMQTLAAEEIAMSDRLKAAGYGNFTDLSMGSILFPLGEELILEPVDEQGKKVGDYSALRKEIGERLYLGGIDLGEVGWAMKRSPEIAQEMFGLQRKDLMVGDDTLGGYLIPATQSTRVIDLLRNRLTVMKAGATEIPLPPSGNITFPRLTADPTFAYGDPDTTTDASSTSINLGVVRLIAKALRGWITIPNDLLRYSSPSIEMVVRMALAAKFAVAEDQQFLEGVGSSLAPKGIINYAAGSAEVPAVGKITLHVAGTHSTTLGDTFIAEDVMKIKGLYYLGNDPEPPTAWIMRPLMWAAIANRRVDAATPGDAAGPFVFWTSRGNMGSQIPEVLGGEPVYSSAQLTKNRVSSDGSTTTTLTYLLYGNFKRLLIGRVGVLELAVSEHVKFFQDKTVIRAVGRNDSGLEHEESFVFVDSLREL